MAVFAHVGVIAQFAALDRDLPHGVFFREEFQRVVHGRERQRGLFRPHGLEDRLGGRMDRVGPQEMVDRGALGRRRHADLPQDLNAGFAVPGVMSGYGSAGFGALGAGAAGGRGTGADGALWELVSGLRSSVDAALAAGAGGAGNGDIVIPVYIGGEMIDEMVVTAAQRVNLRSGGR